MNTGIEKKSPRRREPVGAGGEGSGAAAVYALIIQQAAPFALIVFGGVS